MLKLIGDNGSKWTLEATSIEYSTKKQCACVYGWHVAQNGTRLYSILLYLENMGASNSPRYQMFVWGITDKSNYPVEHTVRIKKQQ